MDNNNQPASITTPPDPTPVSATMPDHAKSSKVWMIVAIVTILILVGVSIFGYIKWRAYRSKVGDQGGQINALQIQVTDLQGQVTTLSAAAAKPATTTTNTASTTTDKDMITAALKAQCAANTKVNVNVGPALGSSTIKSISGNYAQANYLCAGGNEGPEVILVKVSGNWNIVASGIGDFVLPSVRTLYSIPAALPKF